FGSSGIAAAIAFCCGPLIPSSCIALSTDHSDRGSHSDSCVIGNGDDASSTSVVLISNATGVSSCGGGETGAGTSREDCAGFDTPGVFGGAGSGSAHGRFFRVDDGVSSATAGSDGWSDGPILASDGDVALVTGAGTSLSGASGGACD